MIKIAIIEDDPAFTRRLRGIFESVPDIELLASCDSTGDALEHIPATNPDVVLVDIFLGGERFGYDAVASLTPLLPDSEFLMLTRTGDYDKIFASIIAGANGYLLKTEPDERILDAVRDIHAGESVITNSIARKVMQVFRDMAAEQAPPPVLLTVKEIEVLSLVERGKQYKEVAMQLDTSVRTIHSHVRNIYKKLQASNKEEALRRWHSMTVGTGEST